MINSTGYVIVRTVEKNDRVWENKLDITPNQGEIITRKHGDAQSMEVKLYTGQVVISGSERP